MKAFSSALALVCLQADLREREHPPIAACNSMLLPIHQLADKYTACSSSSVLQLHLHIGLTVAPPLGAQLPSKGACWCTNWDHLASLPTYLWPCHCCALSVCQRGWASYSAWTCCWASQEFTVFDPFQNPVSALEGQIGDPDCPLLDSDLRRKT